MARAPLITDDDGRLLMEAALSTRGGRAIDVQEEMVAKGGRRLSLSAVQKKLALWRREGRVAPAEARTPTEERPKDKAGPDDEWSLGLSEKFGLPPESGSDLLEVWRWCLAIGRTFTVREARWVARLRRILDTRQLYRVYELANRYALRERACEALDVPSRTTDLDIEIALEPWERQVVVSTARVKGLPSTTVVADMETAGMDPSAERLPSGWSAATTVERELQAFPRHLSDLPEDADRVYAYWLVYLSKGPEWQYMSQTHQGNFAQRLQEAVAARSLEPGDASMVPGTGHPFWGWRPTELLAEVGYEA